MSDSSAAPLMLSVSGMRGLVGLSLTPEVVTRYGEAIGSWFASHANRPADHAPHIVVGRDSRPSGQMFESAVCAGLLATGCKVTKIGIVSTPGAAVMIDELKADGAVVLTASHNPKPWNGVKVLRHDGTAPPVDAAEEIIRRFKENDSQRVDVDGLQPLLENQAGPLVHAQRVAAQVDVTTIQQAKLTITLDSVCGAGGPEALALMEILGVQVIGMHTEPSGHFPHTPEPTEANLTELATCTAAHAEACAGFAQDPDADRVAIVDEHGRYIGEEYTLALCALHRLQQGASTAANLSTSRMLDDIAAMRGGKVVRTPVGEAHVTSAMRKDNMRMGGEGNGGIIYAPVCQVRNSLIGMAFVLEMLAQSKQSGAHKTLSQFVEAIPAYAIIKDKVPVNAAIVADLKQSLPAAFPDARINASDGVRLDWENRWIHVRASNTEPILRLIAEAPDRAQAQALIDGAAKALGIAR